MPCSRIWYPAYRKVAINTIKVSVKGTSTIVLIDFSLEFVIPLPAMV
jgi:hypothetical protein